MGELVYYVSDYIRICLGIGKEHLKMSFSGKGYSNKSVQGNQNLLGGKWFLKKCVSLRDSLFNIYILIAVNMPGLC